VSLLLLTLALYESEKGVPNLELEINLLLLTLALYEYVDVINMVIKFRTKMSSIIFIAHYLLNANIPLRYTIWFSNMYKYLLKC